MGADEQMDTEIRADGETLYVKLSGKLDTMRAMSLDEQLNAKTNGIKNMTFDLDGLTYIASAGLRILYWAQEYTDETAGKLEVINISPEVAEVFDMTGFNEILSID